MGRGILITNSAMNTSFGMVQGETVMKRHFTYRPKVPLVRNWIA